MNLFALFMTFACAFTSSAMLAQEEPEAPKKVDYKFRQTETPTGIASNSTVAFAMSPVNISTMRGDVLYSTKKNIRCFDVWYLIV